MSPANKSLLPPPRSAQDAVLIMNRQPQPILEKYSRDQVRQLYEFLHNDNPPYRYVFGFRRKDSTEPDYKNADKHKRLPVSKSIDWAIRTICGIVREIPGLMASRCASIQIVRPLESIAANH